MKRFGRFFQFINRLLYAAGKAVAAQCLFLIGLILLLGVMGIGIAASIYIGGYGGGFVATEITGNKWGALASAFSGIGLVLTFLSNYVFWPHIWPVIKKTLDVLMQAISELQSK